MMIAIPEDEWVVFHDLPPVELAAVLVSWRGRSRLPKLPQAAPRPEEAEAREAERGEDQTRRHREAPKSSSNVYKMMPPKGWFHTPYEELEGIFPA